MLSDTIQVYHVTNNVNKDYLTLLGYTLFSSYEIPVYFYTCYLKFKLTLSSVAVCCLRASPVKAEFESFDLNLLVSLIFLIKFSNLSKPSHLLMFCHKDLLGLGLMQETINQVPQCN